MLFETLALSLCQDLPVRQAAQMLRVTDKQLWRRIEYYVTQARGQQKMNYVRLIGIDETSVRRGQQYITVVHDLTAKRLLFATPGRDHHTVERFAQDLQEHGGQRQDIAHACIDMMRSLCAGREQIVAECADQLRPLSCSGPGQRGDG